MKTLYIFSFFLAATPLTAQTPRTTQAPRSAMVDETLAQNPNTTPTNPNEPAAPNPLDPYSPYGSIEGNPGSAFSEANAAAMHFVNIVDNQVYSGAWLDSGGVVQDVVPQKMWSEGMRSMRKHLGSVRARKVTSHQVKKNLNGGLSGKFMIIKYKTQFANHPNAVETLTLMSQPPLGTWKVISYHIE